MPIWGVSMTDTIIQKKLLNSKFKLIIISLLAFLLLLLLGFLLVIYFTLSRDGAYRGVFIDGKNVDKMSYDQIYQFFDSSYTDQLKNVELTLENGDYSTNFNLLDLGVSYNIDKAATQALHVGRQGNIFGRFFEIKRIKKKNMNIELDYSLNSAALENMINDFYDKTLIPVNESYLNFEDKKVTLIMGHPGKSLDIEKFRSVVDNSIKSLKGGIFNISPLVIEPEEIRVDKIYNEISCEPVNAKATAKDGQVVITPHVYGRRIDKSNLSDIIEKHKNDFGAKVELPVVFEDPELKTEQAQAMLFRDTLATSNTNFSTSTQNNYNRGINMQIASSKINGTVLGPGEIFSFNDVVGPRTVQNGYKTAKEYVSGKIVDGIGGGVCQVSSTLYNAVLFSDLETVFRQNHMFSIGYLPLGRDAAVAYSDLDFKFKNNTNWPIKIEAAVKNNTVSFSIRGTQEQPGKTIELSHVQIRSTPAPIQYIDDPNLEEGQTVVIQSGQAGYVVDTYKTVKINGVVQSKNKLHTSTYSTYKTIIKRGTKRVEPALLDLPESQDTPEDIIDETPA